MRKNHLLREVAGMARAIFFLATLMFVAVAFLLSEQPAQTQGFSSGSTGADGALDFSQSSPGTIIEFDPDSFNPRLDPDRDHIYHFTTINIPSGVTVRLTAKYLNGPVFWLATGNVLINGTIDLSGANGHPIANSPAGRIPSLPGAGGFGGGVGGNTSGTTLPQPGNGPLGGGPGNSNGGSVGGSGGFSGTQFLVPLVGGSGGGGNGRADGNSWGGGGGAGGGALLLASSSSLTVNGVIVANGGSGNPCGARAGGGAGGAIRLMAVTLSGTGTLSAAGAGGGCGTSAGGVGRIRLEAFQHNFTGSINTDFSRSSPAQTFVPTTPPPSARVVSIAGVPVPFNPNGTFETPDVTFNDGTAVNVAIEARFVPPGTVVKIHVFSENGADQIVSAAPLQGTLAQSTATASIVFPSGFSRGFVRAIWR